jgi:hypothetical protein
MAGGLTGGILVALQTLDGNVSARGSFLTASGLFVVGAALGMVHGLVLAYLGREMDVTPGEAARRLSHAVLYTIPGTAVAWLLAVWVGLTLVAALGSGPGATILVGCAWIGALSVLAWAGVQGSRALVNAYRRWPHSVTGTTLTLLLGAAVVALIFGPGPSIWMLPLDLTTLAAGFFCAGAVIWIFGPAVTGGLMTLERLPGRRHPFPADGRELGLTLLVAGAAGVALGLLAAVFHTPAVAAVQPAGLTGLLAQAFIDESLLRLFVIPTTAWALLYRFPSMRPVEAGLLGVLAATVFQLLLYIPGLVAASFPTVTGTLSWGAAGVLAPALILGGVFWLRGYTGALIAHGVAVLVLRAMTG